MKKKETLFFIHIIVFLLSSLIAHANTHTNEKSKEVNNDILNLLDIRTVCCVKLIIFYAK